jgi:hypothetical protein
MVRVCIIYPCRASHKCFHYPCWDPDCFCPDGITGKSIIRCTMASMGPKTTSGPCHRDRHLAASEYLPRLILLEMTAPGPALGLMRRGMHEDDRLSLVEVVLDYTKWWLQDTLKEARAGDNAIHERLRAYDVNRSERKVSPSIPFVLDFLIILGKASCILQRIWFRIANLYSSWFFMWGKLSCRLQRAWFRFQNSWPSFKKNHYSSL